MKNPLGLIFLCIVGFALGRFIGVSIVQHNTINLFISIIGTLFLLIYMVTEERIKE
jgi:hypothetical protein